YDRAHGSDGRFPGRAGIHEFHVVRTQAAKGLWHPWEIRKQLSPGLFARSQNRSATMPVDRDAGTILQTCRPTSQPSRIRSWRKRYPPDRHTQARDQRGLKRTGDSAQSPCGDASWLLLSSVLLTAN